MAADAEYIDKQMEHERINAKWASARYGPKTIGLGHAGGPALMLIRPADSQAVDWVAADVVRIRAALNAVRGIPTEALESGVVQEMMEAFAVLVRQASYANRLILEACGPTNTSILEQCLERAKNVLAKARGEAS